MLIPYKGVQWQSTMWFVKKFGQDLLLENQLLFSIQHSCTVQTTGQQTVFSFPDVLVVHSRSIVALINQLISRNTLFPFATVNTCVSTVPGITTELRVHCILPLNTFSMSTIHRLNTRSSYFLGNRNTYDDSQQDRCSRDFLFITIYFKTASTAVKPV